MILRQLAATTPGDYRGYRLRTRLHDGHDGRRFPAAMLIGIDISEEMVSKAKANLASAAWATG